MNNIFPFVALLLVSAMLMLYIAHYSWKKRAIAGAKPLTMLSICVFVWTVGYTLEIVYPTLAWMLFWDNVKLLGMSFASTTLLLFVLEYVGYKKWMERRFIIALLAIPTIFYFLNLTNKWHHLAYFAEPQIQQLVVPALVFEYTTLSWMEIAYNLFIAGLSGVILIHQYFHTSKVYRQQIVIITIGLFVPLATIVLAIIQVFPFMAMDFVAFSMVLSGLIMCVGVFRYGLLDLSPITHTAILANIQDGVVVIDRHCRILEMNASATELLNLQDRDVVGTHFVDVWPKWAALRESCHQNGFVVADVIAENGEQTYLRFRCKSIENGYKPASGLLLFINDVTDQIIAEKLMAERTASLADEVAQQKTEIHLAQERNAIILQHVRDGVAMTGLDGKISYVNQAFVDLTGYEEAELLGLAPTALLGEELLQSIRTAHSQNRSWQGELLFRRKDGRSYVADVMFVPVLDENGRLQGYVSSHRDISKQKDLEKARTQFINNISHELRTPVTNLKLYSELMKLNLPVEKQADYQEIMAKQVDRLERLIEDVLELSALDLGDAFFEQSEVDVQALLETAVANRQPQAEQKVINLSIIPAAERQTIWTDFDQLEKAVGNLIENALNFTPEHGDVVLEYGSYVNEEQPWLYIQVKDKGPGIALEEQDQIFHRFYRGALAESGKIPGTGVGLSFVEQIVRLQGGEIELSSELGQGSTFTIKLPIIGEPVI